MTTNVYPTPADTAHALIRRILQLAENSSNDILNIALSGGGTSALMFDIWASLYKDETPWKRFRFYWVDERCVAPYHPESNYGMTARLLLDRVPLAENMIFRIKGENPPEEECARYASSVARHVPLAEGYPVFDIVLLGAGDDGHTSSIFPGQEHLLTAKEWYAVGVHPQSGQQRIALTGEPIMRAFHIIFLMTGENKKPVSAALLSTADSCPAAYIAHHARHEVELFADEAAFSGAKGF